MNKCLRILYPWSLFIILICNIIIIVVGFQVIIQDLYKEPTLAPKDDGLHSVLISRKDDTLQTERKVEIYPEPNPE